MASGEQKVPVVVVGGFRYLDPTTMVKAARDDGTWPEVPLSTLGRECRMVILPGGASAWVLSWREEALRLRGEVERLTVEAKAAARMCEVLNGPTFDVKDTGFQAYRGLLLTPCFSDDRAEAFKARIEEEGPFEVLVIRVEDAQRAIDGTPNTPKAEGT